MYEDICQKAKQIDEACVYYESFVKHMTNDNNMTCLPLLKFITGDCLKIIKLNKILS